MSKTGLTEKKQDSVTAEMEELKSRLKESEDTLNAICRGQVDSIVVSDATGEKIFSLTSSETPYRIFLEEMEEGAITINSNGIILYCNKRFSNLLSIPAGQIVGSPLEEFVLLKDKQKFYRAFKTGCSGRSNEVISFMKNGNTWPLHLKLSFRAMSPATTSDTCIIASDVTGMKTSQQKLERLVKNRTAKLEMEITERKLKELKLKENEVRLKELIATKDKFFNIIAHDLKNPFTCLIGSTELLMENIDRMGLDNVKNLASILNASSKNGYGILLNLLDWSRAQTGMLKLNPEKVNLHKLIDEQILSLNYISSFKEIKIISNVKKDIFLTTDKNILETVLRNLISNALKFSHRKGLVTINASLNDQHYIISIHDNGTGIFPKELKNLFSLENKLSTPGTENEQGTGLGLKLCKEFIEIIGGEIWVESVEKEGSEFRFSIPHLRSANVSESEGSGADAYLQTSGR